MKRITTLVATVLMLSVLAPAKDIKEFQACLGPKLPKNEVGTVHIDVDPPKLGVES